jgi:hypothetical protein
MPAPLLVELAVTGSGAVALGRLDVAHLADHPAAQAALLDAVMVGSKLGQLLVLDRLEVRAGDFDQHIHSFGCNAAITPGAQVGLTLWS